MAGRGDRWRDRRRALTRVGSIAGAALIALLLVYGLSRAIPDRGAVRDVGRGLESLKRGEYALAEEEFDSVLRRVPDSALARQGLACSYYLTGMRSVATMELSKGLEAGVFAERLGSCEHGLRLDDVFIAAKLGLTEAFAVPRVRGARAFEEELVSEPSGTADEEPSRMLIGACLAIQARATGVAYEYAASAVETDAIDAADRALFLACLGRREERRLGCAARPGIDSCAMTAPARAAYFRDIRFADAPSWQGAAPDATGGSDAD